MPAAKHGYKHCVYVIRNDRTKQAYVGVTRARFKNRVEGHKNPHNRSRSAAIARLSDTVFEQLTDYTFTPEQTKEAETHYFKIYEGLGYEMLNATSALGVMGSDYRVWTLRKVRKEARKYSHRSAFEKGCMPAYRAALNNGWLDIVCGHMISPQNPPDYWSLENLAEEAQKYTSRREFQQGSGSAYEQARAKGYLEQICEHMPRKKRPNGYWQSKERCAQEAQKYKSRTEFNKGSTTAYQVANTNGWLDEICIHMKATTRRPKGYWIKELVLLEASKYETHAEFQLKSNGAWYAARRHGWMDEVCRHMDQRNNAKD